MKAIVYKKYGPADVLKLKDVEKPEPGDNDVLIRNFATSVTSGDCRLRKADPFIARLFSGLLRPKKQILGMDFAGQIETVGKDVTNFKKGDQVFGTKEFEFGCYAEYVCVAENGLLTKKIVSQSYEQSVAVLFGAITALHFLRQGGIQEGQKVLVYGASGAVGTYAVQLAKFFGAKVSGVCSSANTELVQSLGADVVIDYAKDDLSGHKELYDIIFDTVGKSPFSNAVKALKKNGRYLRAVHMAPGSILRGLWLGLTSKRKVIGGVAKANMEDILFLRNLVETGRIRPVIDRKYPMEEMAQAHEYVENGHKKGNVVITIS